MRRFSTLASLLVLLCLLFTAQSNATVPTTQAKYIAFSSVTSSSMTITWLNGNGGNRIVLMRDGSLPVVTEFVDDYATTLVSASTNFSTASVQGNSLSKLVYNGSGSIRTVSVSGLTPGHTYYIMVLEYGIEGIYKDFNNSTTQPNNPRSKKMPLSAPVPAATTNIAATSAILNWSDLSADGYIITVEREDNNTGTLVDGALTSYTDYTDLDVGNVTSFELSNLDPALDHRYKVKAYVGNDESAYSADFTGAINASTPAFTTPAASGVPPVFTLAYFTDDELEDALVDADGFVPEGVYYARLTSNKAIASDALVYVDLNGDGNFTDFGEINGEVADAVSNTVFSTKIIVPTFENFPLAGVTATIIKVTATAVDGSVATQADVTGELTFDNTLPYANTVGAVTTLGGTVVPNFWNATNTSIIVTVPLNDGAGNTDPSLVGGTLHLYLSNNGGTSFEDLGGDHTITNAEMLAQSVAIPITAAVLEANANFAEGATLTFLAEVADRVDNENYLIKSATTLLVDQIAPTINNIVLVSNNTNSNKVIKNGEILTLTFTSNETLATLSDNSATFWTLDNSSRGSVVNNHTVTYAIAGTETQGLVPFAITVMDLAGNVTTKNQTNLTGANVVYDRTSPLFTNNALTPQGTTDDSRVVAGYWNSGNTSARISVVFDTNDLTIVGGQITSIEADNDNNETWAPVAGANFSPSLPYTITLADVAAGGINFTISDVNFAAIDGFIEDGDIVRFRAQTQDLAGNTITNGAGTATGLIVDYTPPTFTLQYFYDAAMENAVPVTYPIGVPVNPVMGGNQNFYGLLTSNEALVEAPEFDVTFANPAAQAAYGLSSVTPTVVTPNTVYKFTRNLTGSTIVGEVETFHVDAHDAAGNATDENITEGNAYWDTDPPTPTITLMDPVLTNLNTVRFSVAWDEPVIFTIGNVFITPGSIPSTKSITDLGGNVYRVDITPADPFENGTVGITIDEVTDLIYNFQSPDPTLSSLYTIENIAPTVVSVTTTKPDGTYRVGEVIPFTVTMSEPVIVSNNTPTITLNTTPSATALYTGATGTSTTTLTFTYTVGDLENVADLAYAATNSLSNGTATITDVAGNTAVLTLPAVSTFLSAHAIVIDNTAPVIAPVTIASNNAVTTLARDGNTVTVTLTSNEPLQNVTVNSILSGGGIVEYAPVITHVGNVWKVAYEADDSDADGLVTFNFTATDIAGNTTIVNSVTNGSSVTTDYTSPEIDPVTIISNNAFNTEYATDGDVVTITLTSGEPLSAVVVNSLLVGGLPVEYTPVVSHIGDIWTVDYTADDTDSDGLVTFNITATDIVGNTTTVSETTDGSTVTTDFTEPVITPVTISSNNLYPTLATTGDVVTIYFTSNEELSELVVNSISSNGTPITGPAPVIAFIEDNEWSISYIVNALDANGVVSFNFATYDLIGNETIVTATTNSSTVTIDKIPPTASISQAPGQVDPSNGTTAMFNVTFSEQVLGFSLTDVVVTTTGSASYTTISTTSTGVVRTITISGIDGSGNITINIPTGSYTDLAGNVNVAATTIVDNTVTFDRVAPLMTSLFPAHDAVNVVKTVNPVITFSENIAKGTGTIDLYKGETTLVESFNVATSNKITVVGNALTINPTLDFDCDSEYYILIPEGAVKDLVNNNYAGFTDFSTWDFETGVSPLANAITGNATACSGETGVVYSVTNNAGNTYLWTVPTGSTITAGQGTNSITVTFGTTSGNITLTETTPLACSTLNTKTITVFAIVAPTSVASDRNNFCTDDAGNITLTAIGGSGTTLRWSTASDFSSTLGLGTPLTILSPTATTTYYARWEAACGNSASANVVVNVSVLPTAAGVITGTSAVCANTSGVVYSIPTIANAISYVWTVPAGATITAGANTNSITVTFGTASGNITAAGNNVCGNGSSSTLAVTVNALPVPTFTSGPTALNINIEATYVTQAGMDEYEWEVDGATIVSGGSLTDNSVTVKWLSTGTKTVSVNYENASDCEGATAATRTVTVSANNNPPYEVVIANTIGTQATGVAFNVDVVVLDEFGEATTVANNTAVTFEVVTGTGTITGSGQIDAGTSGKTISVTYTKLGGETGVSIEPVITGLDSETSNTFTVTAPRPTTQASNIVWNSWSRNQINLAWTNGNGARRIVVAIQGTILTAIDEPVDGTTYTANSTYGTLASKLGDSYVVYDGTGNSATVIGLVRNTSYKFKVYEYSGTGLFTTYLLSDATDNPRARKTSLKDGIETQEPAKEFNGNFSLCNVSPNPVSDAINFCIDTKEAGSFNVELYNLTGELILSRSMEMGVGNNPINIPLTLPGKLAAGSYTLRVTLGNDYLDQKIVLMP